MRQLCQQRDLCKTSCVMVRHANVIGGDLGERAWPT